MNVHTDERLRVHQALEHHWFTSLHDTGQLSGQKDITIIPDFSVGAASAPQAQPAMMQSYALGQVPKLVEQGMREGGLGEEVLGEPPAKQRKIGEEKSIGFR